MQIVSKLQDVINRIDKKIHNERLRHRMIDNITELSLRDTQMLYDDVDFGEDTNLTRKRKIDVDWSNHAEYRSELRNLNHNKLNDMIIDKMRVKFKKKPQDRGKVRLKGPEGLAVVDYNLSRNPADVDVITTWASSLRRGSISNTEYKFEGAEKQCLKSLS